MYKNNYILSNFNGYILIFLGFSITPLNLLKSSTVTKFEILSCVFQWILRIFKGINWVDLNYMIFH